MIEVISGDRLYILDCIDGFKVAELLIAHGDPTHDNAFWINGFKVTQEDVEDLHKAIGNYLRTGFFDGRVRI